MARGSTKKKNSKSSDKNRGNKNKRKKNSKDTVCSHPILLPTRGSIGAATYTTGLSYPIRMETRRTRSEIRSRTRPIRTPR